MSQDMFVRRPGTGRRKCKPQRSHLESAWRPDQVEPDVTATFALFEALGCAAASPHNQEDEQLDDRIVQQQQPQIDAPANPDASTEDTILVKDTGATGKSSQRSRKVTSVPGFGYGGVHLKGPCGNCGVPSSPQWRRGNEECPVLCNACGTWLKKNNTMRPLERIQMSQQPRRSKKEPASAAIKPPKPAKKPRSSPTALTTHKTTARQSAMAAAAAAAAEASDRKQQHQQQQEEPTSSSCSGDLTHAPGLLMSDSSGSLDTSALRPPPYPAFAAAAAAAAAAAGFCPPPFYAFPGPFGAYAAAHPFAMPGMYM